METAAPIVVILQTSSSLVATKKFLFLRPALSAFLLLACVALLRMVVSDEEIELVHLLIFSIPHVFKHSGTPDDLNFILSHMKQAVLHRGVSVSTQRLLVSLLAPLGSFKTGCMDAKELQQQMLKLAGFQLQPHSSVMVVSL